MRALQITFCLLIASCSFSQVTKKIQLKLDDKIPMQAFCFMTEVNINSADTSFIYKLHTNKSDVIEVKKEGKYTLTFNSIFGKSYTKEIVVGKKNNYKLKVKSAGIHYATLSSTYTLSNKLKVGDTLYVIYSSAKEENKTEKLGITKIDELRYSAMIYKDLSNEVLMDYGFNEKTFEIVITTEKTLKDKKKGTGKPDVYTYFLGKEMYSISDPSGEFKAIDKMKRKLFLVEGK